MLLLKEQKEEEERGAGGGGRGEEEEEEEGISSIVVRKRVSLSRLNSYFVFRPLKHVYNGSKLREKLSLGSLESVTFLLLAHGRKRHRISLLLLINRHV